MSDGSAAYNTAKCNNSNVCSAAADICNHAACSTVNVHTCTDSCRHRFFKDENISSAQLLYNFAYCSLFNFCNSARNTYYYSEVSDSLSLKRCFQERLEHICCSVEIRDYAVLKRSYYRNILRCLTEHFLGFEAYGKSLASAVFYCDYRWLI